MENGSTIANKSSYELEKERLRFNGWRGQMQGASKSGPSDWVPQVRGTFAFPIQEKGNPYEDSETDN